jgi:hypothetical protein
LWWFLPLHFFSIFFTTAEHPFSISRGLDLLGPLKKKKEKGKKGVSRDVKIRLTTIWSHNEYDHSLARPSQFNGSMISFIITIKNMR